MSPTPLAGPHRTELLGQAMTLLPQKEVRVAAALDRLGALGDESPGCALWLELLAETSTLLFPDRSLATVTGFELNRRAPSLEGPVVCQATQRADGLHAQVIQMIAGQPEVVWASATLTLAHALAPPPTLAAHEASAIDRRHRTENGAALYAPSKERPSPVPDWQQLVRWTARTGLGQLAAHLSPRGPLFGALPLVTPMCATPAILVAVEQLARWQWYALAGDASRVQRIGRLDWHRVPRPDEELYALLICRGSAGSQPRFDCQVCGPDLSLVLQIQGLELMVTPTATALPPRAEWNSFVRVLEGLGQTAS